MKGMHFPNVHGAVQRCGLAAVGWAAAALKLVLLCRSYRSTRPWDAWACMVTAATLATALRDADLVDPKSTRARLVARAGVVGGLMLQRRRSPIALLAISWAATCALEAARAGGRAWRVF